MQVVRAKSERTRGIGVPARTLRVGVVVVCIALLAGCSTTGSSSVTSPSPSQSPQASASPSQSPQPSRPSLPPGPDPTSLVVGQDVPSFTGKTLAGAGFDLSSTRGKPTVVYLWADWCKTCLGPLAALNTASASQPGIAIVTVALQTDKSAVTTYLHGKGYHLPVVLPADSSALASSWGALSLPILVLIDANGRFMSAYTGALDPARLTSILQTAAGG